MVTSGGGEGQDRVGDQVTTTYKMNYKDILYSTENITNVITLNGVLSVKIPNHYVVYLKPINYN